MGESPQSVVSMRSENVTEIANTNSEANGGTLGAKRRREEYSAYNDLGIVTVISLCLQ